MIDCHGHHNSSGGNGSGKTTLQKLIPIFYGEQVNRVVPTQVRSTKESFTKYYLKSEASFVAFEYTNPKGTCCVILHKKQEQLRYRFIKGALTELFYTEQSKPKLAKGHPIHEWMGELKSTHNNDVSKVIGTAEDYRAILHNDKALIRIRKQGMPDIQHLANTFSLTGVGSHMTLMHKLTYALQTRTSMFSGLEDMIVSTQFDFLAPEKPKHMANKSLANDLHALHNFEVHGPSIRQCISLSTERLLHAQEAAKYRTSLIEAKDKEEGRRDQLSQAIASLKATFEENQQRFEHEQEQLTKTQVQQKSTITNIERQIDTIHSDKDTWENTHNIQFKRDQYDQIDTLKITAEQAAEHYARLLDGISDARADLDREIEKLETKTDKICLTLSSKQHEINNDLQQSINALNTKKEVENTRSRDEYETLINAQSEEKQTLKTKITQLEIQISQTANTEDERITEAYEEENYLSLCQQEENAQDQQSEAVRDLTKIKQSFTEKEDSLNMLKEQLHSHQEGLDALQQQRKPNDASLLAFLKHNKPDWSETIGKVIHPDLLIQDNLNPELTLESAESFYGVNLLLDTLPTPSHAQTDEVLDSAIQAKENEINLLTKKITHLEKDVNQLTKSVNDQLNTVNTKTYQHQASKNHKSASFAKWQEVKRTNKKAREARKGEAKEEIKTLNKNLTTMETKHQEQRAKLKEDSQSYLNEINGLISTQQSDADASIEHLEEQKAQHKTHLEDNVNDLKRAFDQSLIEKGLDTTIEKAAQQKKTLAEQAYQAAKDSIDEIAKYQNWVKTQYSQLPSLEDNLRNTQRELDATNRLLDEKTAAFKSLKKQLAKEKQQCQDQLKNLQENLSRAEILLKDMGELPSTTQLSTEEDFVTLIDLLQGAYSDYKKKKTLLLEKIRSSQSKIEQRQETQIYQQWENIYRAYEANSRHEPYSDEFYLNMPPLFEELLNEYLPQIQASTVEAIIAVGEAIDRYYLSLQTIHREIGSVSKKLSNRINTNQKIKALSEIGIRLVSNVEACGAWAEMSEFNRHWFESTVKSDRKLPPIALGNALRDVIEALEYAHKTPDLKSLISLIVCLKENGNYKEITSDAAMNDASSNGLSLLAVIAIYIGMSRYLCPDEKVSLTWPVDELSTIDLDNIANLFSMLNAVNIRLFSAFPTKEHNILKHFDTCHELVYNQGAMTMLKEAPEVSELAEQLKQQIEVRA